jgi:long-chain fatty acid transport protein
MRNQPSAPLFCGIFLLVSLTASESHATNGYFSHGYGAMYKALAGAGVAFPLNTFTAAVNPAGMVFVESGYDVDVALFNPNRDYTVTGAPSGFPGTFGLAPGTVESGSTLFAIPGLGANWMIDDDSSFGVSLYANGGMNTDYDFQTFGFAPTGVDLAQLFIAPTYSRKLGDRHALGASAILAYQRFRAEGLAAFSPFSSAPANLTDNGHTSSFGGGVRVGYLGELSDTVSVGGSVQTKIYMGELTDYSGLFAEQGGFDIPASWTLGVAVKPNEKVALLFDVQQILYSGITSVNNPLLPNLQTSLLGNDDGAGFGWEDVTVFKIGAQFGTGGPWTWRAGFSTTGQPIPSSEMLFNILAPGVVEQHLTFGFSRALGEGKEISFAVMRAFSHAVGGPNPLEAPGQQDIELRMDQWEFAIGFGF